MKTLVLCAVILGAWYYAAQTVRSKYATPVWCLISALFALFFSTVALMATAK